MVSSSTGWIARWSELLARDVLVESGVLYGESFGEMEGLYGEIR